MTDIATHFPPQTYSSSFFLNALEDDEGARPKIRVKETQDSHNLLDCFITKMSKPFTIASLLFAFLLLQHAIFAEGNECVDSSQPRTRVFETLAALQSNKVAFDATNKSFGGNYVAFAEKDIGALSRNSFVTYDSQHIMKLFLDDHHIQTIQDGAFFSLSCLVTLNLQKNQIERISQGMFLEVRRLHELDLGGNGIREVPERVFIHNALLKKLNLTGNNLAVLHPDSFFNLSRLEELDLSYNGLYRLQSETFVYLHNLLNLQLGSNQLERLELNKFATLSKLNVLNLSDNALESFDSLNNFSFGSSLTELYLGDNLLTQLNPPGIRNNLRALKVIDIEDNPWPCSELLSMLKVFNDSRLSYKGSIEKEPNVAGIACNGSFEEYKKRKTIAPVEPIPLPSTTTNPSAHSTAATAMDFLSGNDRSTSPPPPQKAKVSKHVEHTNDKDIEVPRIWKSKSSASEAPHTGFKRWRRNNSVKAAKVNTNGPKTQPPEKCKDEDMSLLKFLAINALDLSAPASDVLLKSRSSNWFQLSGHPDSLAPAGPGTVWKKRSGCPDDTEKAVYEELSQDLLLRDIIPKYYRQVDYQGEKFIELQDLLQGFQDPHVIDIKMGTRTFLESEVAKTTARNDLYQKMVAIDPTAPTAEEHEAQAVTKLRYMQFRELQSSSCNYGFRIEAMKCRGSPPVTDLKKMKSKEEVLNTLDIFLGNRRDVKQKLGSRLNEIRSRIEQSEYFKTHEVIGSSVFIIYDDSKIGAWIIDFAKTNSLPNGMTVDHRKPWAQGNHEEGFLFGLDQLIKMVEETTVETSFESKDALPKPLPTVSVKS